MLQTLTDPKPCRRWFWRPAGWVWWTQFGKFDYFRIQFIYWLSPREIDIVTFWYSCAKKHFFWVDISCSKHGLLPQSRNGFSQRQHLETFPKACAFTVLDLLVQNPDWYWLIFTSCFQQFQQGSSIKEYQISKASWAIYHDKLVIGFLGLYYLVSWGWS